jgi:BASS family bile acid:Na+ symporter
VIVFVGILVGAVFALLYPEAVLVMKPGLKPAFAVTMFFVGTLIQRRELTVFRASPLRPLAGVLGQYTIMPLASFAVSLFFEDPVIRTGIVLVGCMPGAMASNVITVLVKGDLVFSVTMTALATLVCPLVLAVWLPLLADTRLTVPLWGMVWDATWMVVLPIVVGAALRLKVSWLPKQWHAIATGMASTAIILVVLVVVAINRDRLLGLGPPLIVAMLVLNLSAYGAAFVAATLLKWSPEHRRTFIIEVGMQNAGLGSVLALSHLGPGGAVPSACYTAICVLTAATFLPLQSLLQKRAETHQA